MSNLLDFAIVLLVVATATLWLVLHLVRTRRGGVCATGCNACSGAHLAGPVPARRRPLRIINEFRDPK